MIFAVWKPKGPTSHDIVDKVREATGKRRVGHAGTLDPLAEGVLVIGVGREATRKLQSIVKSEKEYVAEIKLGEESSTGDGEGKKTVIESAARPSEETAKDALKSFVGEIEQTPPVYSALKIRGEPAHRRIRRGEKVELKPREVEIKSIELLEYEWPYLKIRVVTGPGVYVRALARDIGWTLKTGAYLSSLQRTRVGEYTKEKCKNI